MRLHRDERGQTILLVALSLPLMLGFIGMATDVGALFKDKRTLQTAADAAAIAGALNYNNGYTAWKAAGQNAAQANGFQDGSNGVTVAMPPTPIWQYSNYKGQPGYVEATVTKTEPTIFLALFGYPSVTVLARAVASSTSPGGACVFIGVGNTGLTGPALTISGSMQSLPPACGLVDNSTNSPPMTVTTGSLTMSSIGTVGSCDSGCGNASPTPVSPIVPYSDPLAYLPQFTCTGTSCTNGTTSYGCSTANLSQPLAPNCYNGITATNAAINLQPGTYVINGPLNLAGGSLTGTDVTIFMTSGALTFTGTSLSLSAPTSGTYSGILFAQSSADLSPATINANANSSVQGFFYFPDTQLLLDSTFTSAYTGFVAGSIAVNVPGTLSFNNYASLPGVTSPITSAVLVE
jgi:hypothetical protein